MSAAGRVGIAAWTFIGVAIAVAIAVLVFGAIAEVVIPVALAGLLGVMLKPVADRLRGRFRPAVAAGIVVLGLAAVLGGIAAAAIAGVDSQSAKIESAVDDAAQTFADKTGVDTESVQSFRTAVNDSSALVAFGAATDLVAGVNRLVGVASGLLLGTLVFYYVVKDGSLLRRRFVRAVNPRHREKLDEFIDESCATLRSYGRGRTVLSAIVSAVIGLAAILLGLPLVPSIVLLTFVGGYIPYIGAFLAGAYVALIALGESGVAAAITIVVVSLAANLILENFVEPKVMGQTLDIHPLVILLALALGGMLGGIIGLIVAVPAAAIARSAFFHLRESGYVEDVAAKARPLGERLLYETE